MRSLLLYIGITLQLSVILVLAEENPAAYQSRCNLLTGIEYAAPSAPDRDIRSGFAYALFGKEFINQLHYSLYGGVIATYARGNIVQFGDNFQRITYDTEASGLGPACQISVDFVRYRRFFLAGVFQFGVIIYDKQFPPGGDVYNFFRKFGISAGFQISGSLSLCAGLRNLHVSNGQGLGPHNPSYEGLAFSLDVIRHF